MRKRLILIVYLGVHTANGIITKVFRSYMSGKKDSCIINLKVKVFGRMMINLIGENVSNVSTGMK